MFIYFLLFSGPTGHVLEGFVTEIMDPKFFERTERKKEDDGSTFSRYLKYLDSLPCNKNEENYEDIELVKIKLLSTNVFEDEALPMESFYKALVSDFNNGDGKEFCYDLSLMCSCELGNTIAAIPRKTFSDGFKLSREIAHKETAMDLRSSGSSSHSGKLRSTASTHLPLADNLTIRSRKFSSGSHLKGNLEADMVALSNKRRLPLVIFECKSSASYTDIRNGMAQLISYGLSVRDKKQIAHIIKLVLITPYRWFIASLPPYKSLSETTLSIRFIPYGTFGVLVKTGRDLFFDRRAYVEALSVLRQHFESVKLIK